MRWRQSLLALFVVLPCAGCATMCDWFVDTTVGNVVDGCFDAVFGSSTDHVDDDEARILERKGIEPGSQRHRNLKADEERFEEIHGDH